MVTAARFHQPAGAAFPVRHPHFESAERPRYWAAGDPFMTHFMNVLSGLFPDGEQFFVDALRQFRTRIADPQLKRDIGAFIGQEAVHSLEHTQYNRQADAQGMNVVFVERRTAALMRLWKKVSPAQQLALTVATEHLTAVLGHAFMEEPNLHEALHDEQMKRMWLWHAIEENEHKSVAFDALKEINDSYTLRTSAYIAVLSTGIPLVTTCLIYQMIRDGQTLNLRSWRYGLKKIFGRRGLVAGQTGRLLDYFRPGFHPNDHDATALMAAWRATLQLNES